MGLYILILCISTVFALSYLREKQPSALFTIFRRFFAVAFVGLLTVMYIFRGANVGTDYPMYIGFYYSPINFLKFSGVEPGYIWLYQVAHMHTWPLFVTIVSFILINLGMYIFARRAKLAIPLYLSMNVLSYVYFSSFNLVRQMAAMGVCFIGLALFIGDDATTLRQRRFWLHYIFYAAFVYLAMQFHASAIIALALPFCMFLRVRPWIVWSGFVLTMFGFIFKIGNRVVPLVTHFFPHYINKYSSTMDTFFTTGSKDLVALVPIVIQFVILLLIVKYDREFTDSHRWLTSLYFIYLVWFVMAGNQAGVRAQCYWLPSVIYYFGAYLQNGNGRIGVLSSTFFKTTVVLFLVLYTILRIVTNNSGVYPFVFA